MTIVLSCCATPTTRLSHMPSLVLTNRPPKKALALEIGTAVERSALVIGAVVLQRTIVEREAGAIGRAAAVARLIFYQARVLKGSGPAVREEPAAVPHDCASFVLLERAPHDCDIRRGFCVEAASLA